MSHRWIAAWVLGAALAACGQNGVKEDAGPPVIGTAADSSAPSPTLPAESALPQTLPPPAETTPRFVGLWAASPGLCVEPAWRFEADQVSTRGEVHCDFNRVLATPTGYSIAATCYAEGPATPQQIELRFAESARAMMLTGGPWAHATLSYCAPLQPD